MSGDNKPTVVFLNHWAQRMGGAEHSLVDILSRARDYFHCHLITTEQGRLRDAALSLNISCHIVPCAPVPENLRRKNIITVLLFSGKALVSFLFYSYRLNKCIRAIKPDLIHANVPKSHIALFLLRRKGFAGKGCVHLREIFEKGTFPFLLYRVLFQQKNMSVIAISHAVKNRLPEKLRQHASVIYNGIAVPAEEKKYPHKNSVELLYLGRVVPWKGCHLLIDILALLHKKYPGRGIELSIVGDTMYWSSEYRDRLLERIGALNLSSFCHIYPHTDSAETFFLTHDIFCNASVNEPFGRSIAEAQGYGLPVVAFASGGVPEIVITNETGILVPYPDCQAFAEACGRLIDEPGLAVTMGKAARKRASALFDRERQMPLICQFFRERISLQ